VNPGGRRGGEGSRAEGAQKRKKLDDGCMYVYSLYIGSAHDVVRVRLFRVTHTSPL
jgi:hypothetical protein